MPISLSQVLSDAKIEMDGDVPLSITETPANKLGKRFVIDMFKKAFRALRKAENAWAKFLDEQNKEITHLNGRVLELTDENRRLERVMIERGMEIVGLSQKDRQFALPAAASG